MLELSAFYSNEEQVKNLLFRKGRKKLEMIRQITFSPALK
jgi:hypothetical protein